MSAVRVHRAYFRVEREDPYFGELFFGIFWYLENIYRDRSQY